MSSCHGPVPASVQSMTPTIVVPASSTSGFQPVVAVQQPDAVRRTTRATVQLPEQTGGPQDPPLALGEREAPHDLQAAARHPAGAGAARPRSGEQPRREPGPGGVHGFESGRLGARRRDRGVDLLHAGRRVAAQQLDLLRAAHADAPRDRLLAQRLWRAEQRQAGQQRTCKPALGQPREHVDRPAARAGVERVAASQHLRGGAGTVQVQCGRREGDRAQQPVLDPDGSAERQRPRCASAGRAHRAAARHATCPPRPAGCSPGCPPGAAGPGAAAMRRLRARRRRRRARPRSRRRRRRGRVGPAGRGDRAPGRGPPARAEPSAGPPSRRPAGRRGRRRRRAGRRSAPRFCLVRNDVVPG